MTKPRVLISDKMDPNAAKIFAERGCDVDVITDKSPEELAAIIGDPKVHCHALVREGDSVVRLSGNEFGLLVCGLASVEDGIPLAKRLQEAIAQVKKSVTDFPLKFGNFRD